MTWRNLNDDILATLFYVPFFFFLRLEFILMEIYRIYSNKQGICWFSDTIFVYVRFEKYTGCKSERKQPFLGVSTLCSNSDCFDSQGKDGLNMLLFHTLNMLLFSHSFRLVYLTINENIFSSIEESRGKIIEANFLWCLFHTLLSSNCALPCFLTHSTQFFRIFQNRIWWRGESIK